MWYWFCWNWCYWLNRLHYCSLVSKKQWSAEHHFECSVIYEEVCAVSLYQYLKCLLGTLGFNAKLRRISNWGFTNLGLLNLDLKFKNIKCKQVKNYLTPIICSLCGGEKVRLLMLIIRNRWIWMNDDKVMLFCKSKLGQE